MNDLRTIEETLRYLPHPKTTKLLAPNYTPLHRPHDSRRRIALAVDSMKDHMTNEGWQIFEGLARNGYINCGYNLPINCVDTKEIVEGLNPSTVIVQDKREWDVEENSRDFREHKARFHNIEYLASREDIFKLTILKDSHQKPLYHKESAREIGCHAWIIYYHPMIVQHLAPYIRPEHIIRTYHTIDALSIPMYEASNRQAGFLSGAISGVYPLRARLVQAYNQGRLPNIHYKKHPGYHRNGTSTNQFVKELARYKVSICTSSIFGYALRKIIESTASGCIVISDLPTDEVLPYIDGNIVRVSVDSTPEEIRKLVQHHSDTYDRDRQEYLSIQAKRYYDYRAVTAKLMSDIEEMRKSY